MDKGIKNIIFDFGGIIVDLDRQATVQAFGKLGFDTAEAYIGNYVQRGAFSAMETGQMSAKEFCDHISAQAGHPLPPEEIFRAWNRMLVRIPLHRLQLIRSLRPRFRTYLLSNTNAIHWDYSCHRLLAAAGIGMEDCFDRIFLSFKMHLMKPDSNIFRKVMEETKVQPGETLFIDDSEENCRTAERLGMQVFHSQKAEDWIEYLKGKEE